jgi:predicted regulator of Ras-like GTPase activity (Roadblock/LC7/MglB family)
VTAVYQESLEGLTRLRGIAGAMLVSADDGLVVAESLMEGIPGDAVAALAASLMRRMGTAVSAAGFTLPSFMHLQAAVGALLVVPAGPDTLLIAIGDRHINLGLARIEMLQVVEQMG